MSIVLNSNVLFVLGLLSCFPDEFSVACLLNDRLDFSGKTRMVFILHSLILDGKTSLFGGVVGKSRKGVCGNFGGGTFRQNIIE